MQIEMDSCIAFASRHQPQNYVIPVIISILSAPSSTHLPILRKVPDSNQRLYVPKNWRFIANGRKAFIPGLAMF